MGYEYGGDLYEREPITGRLGNGMFYPWTGQDQGYDMATRRREQAEQLLQAQAVEADRSAAFRAQLAADMQPRQNEQELEMYRQKKSIDDMFRTPSLEDRLFPADEPMYEETPATPLAPDADGTMPMRTDFTPKAKLGINALLQTKRSGTAMPISEFREREEIKTDYAKDRATHSTDEGTRGHKERYEDTEAFQRAKALYAAEMQHLENTPMKPAERKAASDAAFAKFQSAISGGAAAPPPPAGPKPGPDGKFPVKINRQIVRMTLEEVEAERAKRKAAAGGI